MRRSAPHRESARRRSEGRAESQVQAPKGSSAGAAAALGALLLALAIVATSRPSWATEAVRGSTELNGRIAFWVGAPGGIDIYSAKPSIGGLGPDPRRLTFGEGTNWDPSWSPDGRRIAFVSDRDSDGAREIYVMNHDGTGVVVLTDNEFEEGSPTWSPDGARIAFHRYLTEFQSEIFVVDADGGNETQLTDGLFARHPSWSFDGSRIAMSCQRPGSGSAEVCAMDADGSNVTPLGGVLPSDSHFPTQPSWSPDGTRIAFHANFDEIRVLNADGSGLRELAGLAGYSASPVFSPDGRFVAFSGGFDEELGIPGGILVVDAETGAHVGSVLAEISLPTGLPRGPSWQRWHPAEIDFEATPSSGAAALRVDFTATVTPAPGGEIVDYRWDADGDGLPERVGAAEYSHVYEIPGTYTASLTVVDDFGYESTATRSVQVLATPGGGRIAFTREDDLFVQSVGCETALALPLLDRPGRDWLPSWFPDGRRIASIGDLEDGTDDELLVTDLETGVTTPLATALGAGHKLFPAVSPDGERIAFSRFVGGDFEIWGVRASDGGDLHQLTSHPASDQAPSWSPDGARIAFQSDRDPPWLGVWATGADGAPPVERLVEGDAFAPAWSPDGARVAFLSRRSFPGSAQIFVANVDGSGAPLQVTTWNDFRDGVGAPAWSPAGERLAFAATRNGATSSDIFAISPDGSGLENVTETPGIAESDPAWQRGLATPIARFSASATSGTPPLAVTFDGSASSDADGQVMRHLWDFDSDGTIDFESGPNVTHVYVEPGEYTATLVVVDDDCAPSPPATVTIEVTSVPPVSALENFTSDVDPLVPGFASALFVHEVVHATIPSAPGAYQLHSNGSTPDPPHVLSLFVATDRVTFPGVSVALARVRVNALFGHGIVEIVGVSDTRRLDFEQGPNEWQFAQAASDEIGDVNGLAIGQIVEVRLTGFEAMFDALEIEID